MKNSLNIILTLVGVLFVSNLAADSATNPFGWDLSYQQLFKANGLPENDTVAKFYRDAVDVNTSQPLNMKGMALPQELFAGLEAKDIQNAIFIDYQAFWFFGHRVSSLYVRSAKNVFIRSYNSKNQTVEQRPIKPERYESFHKALVEWSQSEPDLDAKFKAPKGYVYSGYIGAVSLYQGANKHQFLLTPDDIVHKDMSPGTMMTLQNAVEGRRIPKH